ncbi:FliI/YscN family ATPase [Saliniramus sp.]|uniref:FliI/YscN family ATPase n=1 Tax=Saliniramus sp. TaxID=2986772 RepID=UPI002C06DC83|nr:FliI/YscN family ATPase [Saliniramus sp.]HMB11176.1 FliI/YscN family ATPase [Saliniramus sp.]
MDQTSAPPKSPQDVDMQRRPPAQTPAAAKTGSHQPERRNADRQTGFAGKLAKLQRIVGGIDTRRSSGRLLAVTGPLIRAELPGAEVGELCELRDPDTSETRFAEVVGLDNATAFLAPYGGTSGLSLRTEVVGLRRPPTVTCGDYLLGTVIDALGNFMDWGDASEPPRPGPEAERRPISAQAPDPMTRKPIRTPMEIGIRSIDSLLTMGVGQRMGIFGTAGGGKSTLMSEIVMRCEADVTVVALVGERGREVNDFLEHALSKESRARSVIVAATSDRPSVERMQASLTATAVAEHFRDRGMKVLLFVDTVTRLARALREIGLSAGEPPGRRGFPPSVYSTLPLLVERAGPAAVGSITAFYTVLVEGDMNSDPVAEEVKSLLDGHIILSEKLAAQVHYPAIDVMVSKSRLFNDVTTPEHRAAADKMRELYARYQELELLIQVGEYKQGTDALNDEAVAKIEMIKAHLKQKPGEIAKFADTIAHLREITGV